MNTLEKIGLIISKKHIAKKLLTMLYAGYFKEIGWIESVDKLSPVDANSMPLPWVTYPFIDFIEQKLQKNLSVFEFGSGNSTLWYANKVLKVVSVEHDKAWYEKIKNQLPSNAILNYCELVRGGDYSMFANNLGEKFDVVIVDGRDRVNCIKSSVSCLSDGGVMVLDDSERSEYSEGIEFLIQKNFKKIDFWGISPGLFYKKCTTIFYKQDNCLGI